MNGVHDMGGQHGMGAVLPEPEGSPFYAAWQARVHALVVATRVGGNIDAIRHRREQIPGPTYLAMTYYERWFEGLRQTLLANGLVSAEELDSANADPGVPKVSPMIPLQDVPTMLARQGSYVRDNGAVPAFAEGQTVRARNINPAGHTRLPRYVRGRIGTIERYHGAHVLPDSNAHGLGEQPCGLYTVRFTARELWGADASATDSVSLDLWEVYLDHA